MILAGIDPTQVWTSADVQPFALGTLGADHEGNIYRFIETTAGADAIGAAMIIGTSVATMINTTLSAPGAGAGWPVGFPQAVIAAGGYGWAMVHGVGFVRALPLCVLGTQLNTTGTGGRLDDDATAGAEVINGVALQTTVGGAQASTLAFITWPSVGRTL